MTPKQVTDVDMSRITKKKLPSLTWKIEQIGRASCRERV